MTVVPTAAAISSDACLLSASSRIRAAKAPVSKDFPPRIKTKRPFSSQKCQTSQEALKVSMRAERNREMEELEFPYSPGDDLYDLESYYKMLDLYFQFSRKAGLPVQTENLAEERRRTEEEISRILKTECASYSRKCSACGKELSWDYPFSVCERCFERGKINRAHNRGGRRHSPGTVGRV